MDLEIGTVLKYDGEFFKVVRKTSTQYVCIKIRDDRVEMRFRKSGNDWFHAVGNSGWAKISSMEAFAESEVRRDIAARVNRCYYALHKMRRGVITSINLELTEKFLDELGVKL